MNVITGEKIQQLADYYLGRDEDFNYNPVIQKQPQKHVDLQNLQAAKMKIMQNEGQVLNIFCYTNRLDTDMNNVFDILQWCIPGNCNLILHNSDGKFEQKHKNALQPLLTKGKLLHIYTQNINIEPDFHVIPLPIGIANSMWNHGSNQWNNMLFQHSKPLEIFFNFQIGTNAQKRQRCFEILSQQKKLQFSANVEQDAYLKALMAHKYAICPEGNGTDTHRFWECLYLKTIPICLKNPVTVYYSTMYPVYLLDDWTSDFSSTDLTNFYNTADWSRYDMLFFDNFAQSLFFSGA